MLILEVVSPGKPDIGEYPLIEYPRMKVEGNLDCVVANFFHWLRRTNQAESKELTVMINGHPVLELTHKGEKWVRAPKHCLEEGCTESRKYLGLCEKHAISNISFVMKVDT